MSFGSNMKAVREKLGITQDDLARSTCVTPSLLCAIEKDRKQPSLALALGIAERLSTDVETLAGVKKPE